MKRLLIAFMLLAGASTALKAQNMNSNAVAFVKAICRYLFSLSIRHLRSIFSAGASNLFNPAKHSLSMIFASVYFPKEIIEVILFPP